VTRQYESSRATSTTARRVRRTTDNTARILAVYDGRDRLGTIERRGDEYIARDNLNRSFGVYHTAIEATAAISARAARGAVS
jgi:hypothetical protein